MITRRTTLTGAAALLGVLGGTGLGAGRAGARDPGPLLGPALGEDLHLMTWNVRVPQPGTRPGESDHWGDRAPYVVRLLAEEQPTVLALQEVTGAHLDALAEALPSHRLLGFGYGEETLAGYPVLSYDADRLEVLTWGRSTLSATPTAVDSRGWGNRFARSLVWARARDTTTGRVLGLVVTHLDHESELARVLGARLVRDRVDDLDCPTLVLGDFNAAAGASLPYAVLTGDGVLRDTWTSADTRITPAWGTFPSYGPPVRGERRIDWLLATEEVTVARSAINATRYSAATGERWPSDHTPVQALVRLV
ncbi:endonuclease/exonuclease/phosphatase family protein [Nocardioides sp. CFH 31398]|uniref:endonuclease/exonuclease/phosphatase family protein n=1 Tax=Nocardioides sp. CFH 31398 TaxID=2919579 RepID=UPI001F05B1AC|nr:endonuclease/exonuclease/phosphatase family protein [Nocardioides sp. CFH 31398]MCH1867927.1 endonuclease/exonuclease/phosphatase family protein [Nocardioides sp. CFH 31398]